MARAEFAALGKRRGNFDSIPTKENLFARHVGGGEFLDFLFRGGDKQACLANHLSAKNGMINSLEPKAPDNRKEHTYRLDHIGNIAPPARVSHRGPQKIVKPEDVNHIEIQ